MTTRLEELQIAQPFAPRSANPVSWLTPSIQWLKAELNLTDPSMLANLLISQRLREQLKRKW
jgi:hypothetical protein